MRFWESSAVVPLIVEERSSRTCRKWLKTDEGMVVWALTRTEVYSALCRRRHGGTIDDAAFDRAKTKLETLARRWREVTALIEVRGHAERFLFEHRLRAADSLQLGAAFHYTKGEPKKREFVVLDGPLVHVAAAEGFTVLTA